jgi:enamine deaminase RidA (YjgF/YER057c/UK114 family)
MTVKRIKVGQRMSQAVVHNGVVYTAGQVAADAPGESVEKQTRNILERIEQLLEEAGSDKSRILSATIWLADMANFDQMNAVWDDWVEPGQAPARACVESRLAAPEFAVEIGIIAAL